MGKPNVNVVIGGNKRSTNTGKTIVLKNNLGLAEQLTEENAKYVVKWDFDIANTVEIPEGCVLEFEGGSINGTGTLKGDFTQIDADKVPIFSGINISGTWNVPEITSAWFRDAAEMNRLKQLINLTHGDVYNTVTIEEGEYLLRPFGDTSKDDANDARNDAVAYPEFYPKYNTTGGVDYSDKWRRGLMLRSNTKFVLIGDIRVSPTLLTSYNLISIGDYGDGAFSSENVTITGTGSIIGEMDTRPDITYYSKGIPVITRPGTKNLVIENITLYNHIGTCISASAGAKNVVIRNVTIKDGHWYGVSLSNSSDVTIENCVFTNLYAGGMDLEPQAGDRVEGVVVRGCEFYSIHKGMSMLDINSEYAIKDILIEGCNIHDLVHPAGTSSSCGIRGNGAMSNITIRDCRVECGGYKAIWISCMEADNDEEHGGEVDPGAVFDRRDLCDTLVVDGCIISSTAETGFMTFYPNVLVSGCKMTTGGIYLNRDYNATFPASGDQSLKSAAKFNTTITGCDITVTGRYVTTGSRRLYENCNFNYNPSSTSNGLSRNEIFRDCHLIMSGTRPIDFISGTVLERCSIQVEDTFAYNYVVGASGKFRMMYCDVRTESYDKATPPITHLVRIANNTSDVKIIGNTFDINCSDGSIAAIACRSDVTDTVIDGNFIAARRNGYKTSQDPFNVYGSYRDAIEKTKGLRNNILPYGSTSYRNGVGPEVLNCLNGAPFYDETIKKTVYYNRSERAWVTEEGFSVLATKGTTAQRPTTPYTEREGEDLPTDGSKIYVGYTFHLTANDSYQIASAINSSGIITWTPENTYSGRYVPSDVRRSGTTAQRPDDEYVYNYLYVGFEYFDTTEQRYCYVQQMERNGEPGDYTYYAVWGYRPLIEGLVASRDTGYRYFDTTLGKWIAWNGFKWVTEEGFSALATKGASAQRPALSLDTDEGYRFFDTNLNRYIYFGISRESVTSWSVPKIADRPDRHYFVENIFEQGHTYEVRSVMADSVQFGFSTTNDDSGTEYSVPGVYDPQPDNNNKRFSFTAPDPNEYPYVDLYCFRTHDTTYKASEVHSTWLEYDGSPVQE